MCAFYSPPGDGKRFTSLRALLKVADPFIYQPDSLKQIIMTYAKEFEFIEDPDGPLKTYLVGDLLVILADGSFVLRYTPYETATSLLPSTDTITAPMTFATVFTSYSFIPPQSTPGMVWPQSSSLTVIVYSKSSINEYQTGSQMLIYLTLYKRNSVCWFKFQ